MFQATFWDYGMFWGTIGLFFTLFFLFIRFLPVISIAEMRAGARDAATRRVSAEVSENE